MKRSTIAFLAALLALSAMLSGCALAEPKDQAAGSQLVWKGELDSAPANPQVGWAYYSRGLNEALYWSGEAWTIIGNAGSSGASGIALLWQGSFASVPASPHLNWAYYNSIDQRSYVYDGAAWTSLSQANTAHNARGMVHHGAALTLTHGLNRANLDFNAQFEKDGQIFDIGDYFDQYPVYPGQRQKAPFSAGDSINWLNAAINVNGRTLAAFMNDTRGEGYFTIVDSAGAIIQAPSAFMDSPAAVSCISVAALTNGNFVIAYNSGSTGHFRIFDQNGVALNSSSEFDAHSIYDVAVTDLDGAASRFVIAWSRSDGNSKRVHAVYSPLGAIVGSEAVSGYYEDCHEQAVVALPGGGFAAYYHFEQNGQFGVYDLYDSSYAQIPAYSSPFSDCSAAWAETTGAGVTAGVDSDNKDGNDSATFSFNNVTGPLLLASEAIASTSLTGFTGISFYIKSNVGRSASQLQLLLDSHPNCASPEETIDVPGFPGDSAWYRFILPLPEDTGGMSIASIGLRDTISYSSGTTEVIAIDDIRLQKNVYEKRMYGSNLSITGVARADGSVGVLYNDVDNLAWYKAYDSSTGNLLMERMIAASAITISSSGMNNMGIVRLEGEDTALAYGTTGNGYFEVYDPSYGTRIDATQFEWDSVDEVNAVALPNREFLIFYRDTADSNRGYFVREGDYSLYLERVDNNSARIWNYTGGDLTLDLSVNQ
jgi:hypothetical protein